jgi:hypothetical protein
MTISNIPRMDAEGLECFQDSVAKSKCYLEYGAGGSTLYAANVAKTPNIICIESDDAWRQNVLSAVEGKPNLLIEHCDIGETGQWGNPVDLSGVMRYWRYYCRPWQIAARHKLCPDLVLIDGRFRVACFLYSLLSAQIGTRILFDDYFDRPIYFMAEKFCHLQERRGRMAVFSSTKDFSMTDICERISQYSVISNC